MKRQQAYRRWVAALAAASLFAALQTGGAGPAAASGYQRHGTSWHYGFGDYWPHYGPPYRHGRYGYYRYRYGHYSHRYGYGHYGHSGVHVGIYGHGSGAAVAVGALGAGLLLGHLLTRPAAPRGTVRSAPAPARGQPGSPTYGYGKRVARDCKPTTGRGAHNGRPAIFGGTFCYDANGQGYIVPGSAHFIGYAD